MNRILIVEPNPSGHCAFYLSLIVQAFPDMRITLLAPPGDPDISAHFARRGMDLESFECVAPVSIAPAELVNQAAAIVGRGDFGKVFFCYMDTYLPALLDRAEGFPCPVAGIWFHPYELDWHYRWMPPVDKRLKRRSRVHRGLRNGKHKIRFERLCFLDEGAPEKLRRIAPGIPATALPDPWEKRPSLDTREARERFGLPQDRKIFLHIGSSEKRKGLSDVIAAFRRICDSPGPGKPLLLRVGENGRLNDRERAKLEDLKNKGYAQLEEGHVPEEDFLEYFSAADWVLLPYRRFRFSSGILSNAIAAGKPVIASDYGLIGRKVKEYSLGSVFMCGSSRALENAIRVAFSGGSRSRVDPDLTPRISPVIFVSALKESIG